ncbi:hypothetical protein CFC21_009252 [Triticum aestivum]|uniref:GCK domain-containing protein n=2 Tax=Triticum aestivum TaxID=4565 RepID=A0A9R1ITP2_WHEAT|nr:hypothetical protein CFC21_009252 [Triticum aestivum]
MYQSICHGIKLSKPPPATSETHNNPTDIAMAEGWWKRARATLAKLPQMARVIHDMRAGGCIKEFEKALEQCEEAMADKKPKEGVSCAKATAALRKCMEGKDVLAKHLVALDEGIMEDEWRRWDPYVQKKLKLDPRYRWWTGMKKSEEE